MSCGLRRFSGGIERDGGCGGATARAVGSAGRQSTPSCGISSDACGGRTACGGENRIAGELAKLGWRVSPRTVAKYRPKDLERGRGGSWRTFLRSHASDVWSCDFFTVVTVHFQTLYAFVVVSLERRGIVHVGVTAHPTSGAE